MQSAERGTCGWHGSEVTISWTLHPLWAPPWQIPLPCSSKPGLQAVRAVVQHAVDYRFRGHRCVQGVPTKWLGLEMLRLLKRTCHSDLLGSVVSSAAYWSDNGFGKCGQEPDKSQSQLLCLRRMICQKDVAQGFPVFV